MNVKSVILFTNINLETKACKKGYFWQKKGVLHIFTCHQEWQAMQQAGTDLLLYASEKNDSWSPGPFIIWLALSQTLQMWTSKVFQGDFFVMKKIDTILVICLWVKKRDWTDFVKLSVPPNPMQHFLGHQI